MFRTQRLHKNWSTANILTTNTCDVIVTCNILLCTILGYRQLDLMSLANSIKSRTTRGWQTYLLIPTAGLSAQDHNAHVHSDRLPRYQCYDRETRSHSQRSLSCMPHFALYHWRQIQTSFRKQSCMCHFIDKPSMIYNIVGVILDIWFSICKFNQEK